MRLLTRLLAVLLGLALLVGGLAVAVEIGLSAVAHRPVLLPYRSWLTYGRDHPWRDSVPTLTGLGLLLLGLLLLIVGLRRRAPLAVPGAPREWLTVTFARRPLEASLGRLAVRTCGVEGVKVRLRRRTARVSGRSLATDLAAAGAQLSGNLEQGLERLPIASPPSVSVDLRRAAT